MMILIAAGCGSGKDRDFTLPPGAHFDSNRSGRVLVVVEASNDCEAQRNCVSVADPTTNPAGCDLGSGNTRGLAVYRLGESGLLFEDPGSKETAGAPEQTIGTAYNPRRLIAHPNDASLLYVATLDRIQVFRLAPDGATRCIDQTLSEKEANPRDQDTLDPIDLTIDPSIGNGILYVASSGASRIDAYTIEQDGTLPEVPTSCALGPLTANFAAVALAGSDFVAAAGWTSIDVYRRQAGQFPAANPDPSATPSPSPSPSLSECVNASVISEPVSSIGAGLVTDLLFWPSVNAPIGQLVVSEEATQQIFAFSIDAAGTVRTTATSNTERAGVYQRLLRHDRGNQAVLYASVFNEGRVDAFRLENDRLPAAAFSKTAEDPRTLPVGVAIDDPGTVLYVAQGGLGRVDGYNILADGALEPLPATSTRPIIAVDGSRLDTFPNDVAVLPLP